MFKSDLVKGHSRRKQMQRDQREETKTETGDNCSNVSDQNYILDQMDLIGGGITQKYRRVNECHAQEH